MKIEHEIIKWLLDISKYVITAVIISSFLMGLGRTWQVYMFGFIIAGLVFTGAIVMNKRLKIKENS